MRFERRSADGTLDSLPALAAELVRAKVDVILAESSFAVDAARKATKTIPIVMTGVGNPVGSGFVKSISQPGGNITGLTNVSIEVSSKYLEYLYTAVPNSMRVGVLVDPKHPNHPTVLKQVEVGAQAIGASVSAIELRSVSDIDAALSLIQQERQFIINLKTAKSLGLTVSPALLTSADEVIE